MKLYFVRLDVGYKQLLDVFLTLQGCNKTFYNMICKSMLLLDTNDIYLNHEAVDDSTIALSLECLPNVSFICNESDELYLEIGLYTSPSLYRYIRLNSTNLKTILNLLSVCYSMIKMFKPVIQDFEECEKCMIYSGSITNYDKKHIKYAYILDGDIVALQGEGESPFIYDSDYILKQIKKYE